MASTRTPTPEPANGRALNQAPGILDAFRAPYEMAAVRAVAGSEPQRYHRDDMLTVADAAQIARRSVRTLRRAYTAGRLLAHRDGNGRGVTIRYGDLLAWLTAEVISPAPTEADPRVIARVDVRARPDATAATGNAELLEAALRRRGPRRRASAAPRAWPARGNAARRLASP